MLLRLLLYVTLSGCYVSAHAEEVRLWTSSEGTQLQAVLRGLLRDAVLLETAQGELRTVPQHQLCAEDQAWIDQWVAGRGYRQALGPLTWPQQIRQPIVTPRLGALPIGGWEMVLPHFTFQLDVKVSEPVLAEFATMAECMLQAMRQLPWAVEDVPKGGYTGRILADRQSFVRAGGQESLAGIYVGHRLGQPGMLLIPAQSMGLTVEQDRAISQEAMNRHIWAHEVVHQICGDALLLMPIWFREGLAECLSRLPYQNGIMDWSERGIREGLSRRLTEMREIGAGHDDVRKGAQHVRYLIPLRELIDREASGWEPFVNLRETHRTYFTAHLLTLWLLRVDDSGQAIGLRVGMHHIAQALRYVRSQGREGHWPLGETGNRMLDARSVQRLFTEEVLANRDWDDLERQMRADLLQRWSLRVEEENR